MPIFEFHCNDCGTVFEEIVFGSDAEVACKKCHSNKVEKLMSAVSFKCGAILSLPSGSSGGSSPTGNKCGCGSC